MRAERIINLGMRACTLTAKFVLLFFMAKYLSPEDVALYGLMYATVAYSVYFLGFDFYTFTTRELIGTGVSDRGHIVKQQLVVFFFCYMAFVGLSVPLFALDLLPWGLYPIFLALLVLEHLGQELYRLLVALSDQLVAGVILFARTGLWTLFAAGLIYSGEDLRHVEVVFWCWLAGGAVALLAGASRVATKRLGGWRRPTRWRWIGRGLRIAAPLLVATLAIRAVLTVDRYWVELLANADVLAAYVFFIGLANALMSLLESGVFVFSYPALVEAAQQSDMPRFRRELALLWKRTLLIILVFVFFAWLLIEPLLGWVGRPAYSGNAILFPWVLAALIVFALGMVPHYSLYALELDRHIIISHISGLVVFLVSGVLLAPLSGHFAVPAAMVLAFLVVLVWKQVVGVRALANLEVRSGLPSK
jgi:O-antigen/teichoic acid export membrane protein